MTESIADLEDALLRAMLMPNQSMADLANACGWRTSKVQRVLNRLEKAELVRTKRGVATLTEVGKTVANEIKAAGDHLAALKSDRGPIVNSEIRDFAKRVAANGAAQS